MQLSDIGNFSPEICLAFVARQVLVGVHRRSCVFAAV